MYSDTVQPMQLGMANGGRSRSSWCHLRACLRSLYMQRLDITLHRNEWPRLAALFLFILCASFVVAQQAQPARPASQQAAPPQAQQAPQGQTSGALPNGIHREGTDNILVDASGIPLEDQSGKTLPQVNAQPEAAVPATAPPPNVGSNTVSVPNPTEGASKHGDRYVFKSTSEEVVLHATVVDQHSR